MSVSHWTRFSSSPHRPFVPMNASARLYYCVRCHCQVLICRRCDRGNVYCAGGCAEHARKASLHRAGSRYRCSRQGRLTNAARQQRFRDRQKQKVTHQGSPPPVALALLLLALKPPESPQAYAHSQDLAVMRCRFCGRACDAYLRQHFLRPMERARRSRTPRARPARAGDHP